MPDNPSLDQVCLSLGIPSNVTDYGLYRPWTPTANELITAAVELNRITDNEIISFGGLSVQPNLLGFRQMRRTSNDLDCITSEEGVRRLNANFNGNPNFFYNPRHGDLFLEFMGLPCSFMTDKIHDFEIPNDLRETAIALPADGGTISTISPEYLIVLKIRRLHSKGKVYGKDRIDVANMLLAPEFRRDLREVDYREIANLLYRHISTEYSVIQGYLEIFRKAEASLSHQERLLFRATYRILESEVAARYNGN